MFEKNQITQAIAGLSRLFDAISPAKFRQVHREAELIEMTCRWAIQAHGTLSAVRDYFLEYGLAEKSPIVQQIDKLIPRNDETERLDGTATT